MSSQLIVIEVVLAMMFCLVVVMMFNFRRLHSELRALPRERELDRFYDRLESLFSLYRDLKFDKALPALRHHSESPDFLREVVNELQTRKPERVLELGGGVSTLVFARALQRNGKGHLHVVEHEPFYVQQLKKWLRDYQLDKFVTVIQAELTDYTIDKTKYRWYTLNDIPMTTFDVIVADGRVAKESRCGRYPTLPLLQNRLSESSVIVVEHVEDIDDREVLIRWSLDFPQYRQRESAAGGGCSVLQRVANSAPNGAAETLACRSG